MFIDLNHHWVIAGFMTIFTNIDIVVIDLSAAIEWMLTSENLVQLEYEKLQIRYGSHWKNLCISVVKNVCWHNNEESLKWNVARFTWMSSSSQILWINKRKLVRDVNNFGITNLYFMMHW